MGANDDIGVPVALGQAMATLSALRGDLVSLKDGEGRYSFVNGPMASFLQCTAQELIGRIDSELFEPSLLRLFRAAEQTALAQPSPLVSEHVFEWHGKRRVFAVSRARVDVPGNDRPWLASIWSDVHDEQMRAHQLQNALAQLEQEQQANLQLRRALADQALRDQASGLHSRAHFEEQLRRELDLSAREHREFALVFIELSLAATGDPRQNAKVQDGIFEAMGKLLRGGTRAMDASCRWDARRFTVLLSGVGLATAHSRMESLRRQCATQIVVIEGVDHRFSTAMGVASFPHTASDREALMAACEAALDDARQRGGNQVALASIRFNLP